VTGYLPSCVLGPHPHVAKRGSGIDLDLGPVLYVIVFALLFYEGRVLLLLEFFTRQALRSEQRCEEDTAVEKRSVSPLCLAGQR
jgi:hypothetical protein